jgi:hypothetical protein
MFPAAVFERSIQANSLQTLFSSLSVTAVFREAQASMG